MALGLRIAAVPFVGLPELRAREPANVSTTSFQYVDPLPLGKDTSTEYRLVSPDGVRVTEVAGRRFLDDEAALSEGIFDAYQQLNLRYSQMSPTTFWDEKNTGTNLPAQIELYHKPGQEPVYEFLFMAKGGGSANKTFLYQETKALLNPTRLARFLDEKLRALGTAACPPYHLAVVVGGLSAEYTLKVAKLASARYLDTLPLQGSPAGH